MSPLFWLLLVGLSPPSLPAAELVATVRKSDADLFETFFERCDPSRLRGMLTPDFEMYHDKAGVVATSAEQFVQIYAHDCSARSKPDAWRSRRQLVENSLHVDAVPGFGAIEHGEHLFYERQGTKPERLSGRARFTQIWKWNGSRLQLARVISFNHQPASGER